MTGNQLSQFTRIFSMLPKPRKVQYLLLVGLMVLVGILETITLGLVALFATWLGDAEKAIQTGWVRTFAGSLPFVDIDSPNLIYFLGGGLILAVLLKNGVSTVVAYGNFRFGAVADGFYGRRLLEEFMRLPYEWHQTRNSADLVIAINWRTYLGTHFLGTTLQLLCDSLVLVFLVATLFAAEPLLSTYIITGFGFAAVVLFYRTKRRIDQKASGRKHFEEKANRDATLAIHGMKDVKIFLKEEHFLEIYAQDLRELARYFGSLQFFQKLPTVILETLGIISVVLIACGMLYLMEASASRVTGMLAMLVACAWRALPALNRILAGATQLKSSSPYIANFLGYLDEVVRWPHSESFGRVPGGSLEFKVAVEWAGVSFRYINAHADALSNIDMTIRKGETLGIIGASGAGKSTLVDVLIGLNAPSEGRITVDGKLLRAEDRRQWRGSIGYVPQTPYIYDGTLAENIAFGIEPGRIDRDRVLECCRMASIDFLGQQESGIDSQIGERGSKLSGGQRQRIAIARALYHRPSIVIFDEATSALDSRNEKAIQDTIYALKGTLTVILIAHRLSTVTECDRVICLRSGRIAMEGPPETVLPWYSENAAVIQERHASEIAD